MKKVIALLIALIIAAGCVSVAFAADKPLNYVLLGDSIAWGAGVYNSDEACFGRIVANTNGYNYKNDAVNGFTTGSVLNHLKHEQIRKDVAAADIISLSIGGNNYLQQNLPRLLADYIIGKYDIIDDIEENMKKEFAEIIETVKALNPDVKILVNTLYNPRFDLLRDFYNVAVVRVNRTVKGYLNEHPGAYELIDVHSVFTFDHPEYIAADTIHPSAVGNEVIAGIVLDKLYEIGIENERKQPVISKIGIDQIPFMSIVLKAVRDFFDKTFSIISF
ncbi:MAG: SGNH/GDSL hydrolase family protein [Clostridia bacterium]|nr:SGNH/GDSL hydrolase family protein [Clostridia bacterium]